METKAKSRFKKLKEWFINLPDETKKQICFISIALTFFLYWLYFVIWLYFSEKTILVPPFITATGTVIGAIINITVAVFISNRGIRREKKKDINKQKDLANFFHTLADNIEKPLIRRAWNFSRFSAALNRKDTDVVDLKMNDIWGLETLLNISQPDLFKALVESRSGDSKEKVIWFDRINKNISSVKKIEEFCKVYFHDFDIEFRRNKDSLRMEFQNISKIYDRIHAEVEYNKKYEPQFVSQFGIEFQKIVETYNSYKNSNNVKSDNYFDVEKFILVPLKNLCDRHYGSIPDVAEVLQPLRLCIGYFSTMKYLQSQYSSFFKDLKLQLLAAKNEIKKSSDFIKTLEWKE